MGESQRELESVRSWTRELAALRSRAVKGGLRIAGHDSPLTELTDDALSACDSLLRQVAAQQLERDRLRRELHAEARAWQHLFAVSPTPSILTDAGGYILAVNRAAGLFLNVSPGRLKGRTLLMFTEERGAFASMVERLPYESGAVQASFTIRPRERKPVKAVVVVTPAAPDTTGVWLWFMVPAVQAPATASLSARYEGISETTTFAEPEAGEPVLCHRCGGDIGNGHHFSSDQCAESLDQEIESVQSRLQHLRHHSEEFSQRHKSEGPATARRSRNLESSSDSEESEVRWCEK